MTPVELYLSLLHGSEPVSNRVAKLNELWAGFSDTERQEVNERQRTDYQVAFDRQTEERWRNGRSSGCYFPSSKRISRG